MPCRVCGRGAIAAGEIDYCGMHLRSAQLPLVAIHAVPPQDLEAELALLGCCLLEPASLPHAGRIVRARDFYRKTHGDVWQAMWGRYKAHGDTSITAVHDCLCRRDPKVKWHILLAAAAYRGRDTWMLCEYAEIVSDLSARRERIATGLRSIWRAYDVLEREERQAVTGWSLGQ